MNLNARRFRIAVLAVSTMVVAALSIVSAPPASAASFTVNSTGDQSDGNLSDAWCDADTQTPGDQCTLRAALEVSNHKAGQDTINFDIGTGAVKISPTSALPTLTDPLIIDGTTQAGFSGTPLIEVNGDASAATVGLDLSSADDSVIKGLAITGFDTLNGGGGIGIRIGPQAGGNFLLGNFIGLDPMGAAAGNYWGIRVASEHNVIGDGTAAGRNVISANSGTGLVLEQASATGNVVRGNRIGTNPAGTAAVGNGIGMNIYFAEENAIGGTGAGHGNLISGNALPGFGGNLIMQAGVNNSIQGNLIGTDVTGTVALGGENGITVYDGGSSNATGNVIGGGSSAGNVIAGNAADGIELRGESGSVRGNRIGVTSGGDPLPNGGNGIEVLSQDFPTSDISIGGGDPSFANVIAHNGGDGVFVDADVEGIDITGNSIHSNGGLGIDLAPDGVASNDALDADTGANELHNFPVINRIVPTAKGTTVIKGILKAEVGENYRLEFFLNNQADPSNFGEGQTFLRSTNVGTNAEGVAKFTVTVDRILPPGKFVTATSTLLPPLVVGGLGGTSEFSKARRVCTILGTNGPDTLAGGGKGDVICGLGGNDELKGLGGADVLLGGKGADDLFGGNGRDLLLGQTGNDALNGGRNKDICRQGPGSGARVKCEA